MSPSPPVEVPDHAGVTLHPPRTYLSAVVLGLLLQGFFPLPLPGPGGAMRLLGGVLVLASVALFVSAVRLFRQLQTPLPPWKPTRVLIQDGPYRRTRNPLYLAMSLAQAGLALVFLNPWLLITLVLVVAAIRWLVIAREEAYLTRVFGDIYTQYQRRVRRWL